MQMIHRIPTLVLGLSFWLAASTATASDTPFDGSKKMICAIAETHECVQSTTCVAGNADDVRMPRMIEVNVKKKKIEILDESRKDETSEIERVDTVNGVLFLMGIEATRAWSAAIRTDTGTMVVSITDPSDAVAAFGACVLD